LRLFTRNVPEGPKSDSGLGRQVQVNDAELGRAARLGREIVKTEMEGNPINDPEGVDLSNDDAARDEGQRIVRELKESG
jgi:hypothetical protein